MIEKPLITVFGSHSPSPSSREYVEAEMLGKKLAEAGFRVATGGYSGIMEAALKGAGGGIGFTASIFAAAPNKHVTKEICSDDLLVRISMMIKESAGFILLKGGTGTLLELAACWEMVNKKMVPCKPIICIGLFWKEVVTTQDGVPSIEDLTNIKPATHSAASYIYFVDTSEHAVHLLIDKLLKGE